MGEPRNKEETRAEIEMQLALAIQGDVKSARKSQTATGIKDCVTEKWINLIVVKRKALKHANPGWDESQMSHSVRQWLHEECKQRWSPLLDVRGSYELTHICRRGAHNLRTGLDPHTDTPIEILHTILLGVVKYVWIAFHGAINDQLRETFVVRL